MWVAVTDGFQQFRYEDCVPSIMTSAKNILQFPYVNFP